MHSVKQITYPCQGWELDHECTEKRTLHTESDKSHTRGWITIFDNRISYRVRLSYKSQNISGLSRDKITYLGEGWELDHDS